MRVGGGDPRAEIEAFFENRAKRALRLAVRNERAGKHALAMEWNSVGVRYRRWLDWLIAESPGGAGAMRGPLPRRGGGVFDLQRGRGLVSISEAELQRQIVEALEVMRFKVLVTTVKIRSKNPKHHRTGQSKGIPDVIISKPQWMEGIWLGLEVKSENGRVRPEQQELARLGRIVIVRSLDEAIEAARTADGELRRAGGTRTG